MSENTVKTRDEILAEIADIVKGQGDDPFTMENALRGVVVGIESAKAHLARGRVDNAMESLERTIGYLRTLIERVR